MSEHKPDWSGWGLDHPEEEAGCTCGYNGTFTECAESRTDQSAFPRVQHRIEGGKFVCPGDENSQCHRYPDCDGEHEFWPCGCDYIGHAGCWVESWISASDLRDSHDEADGIDALRDEDFPDGDVSWSWEGEYVLFSYCDPAPNQPDGSES